MATYAIGDIQGCHEQFTALLDELEFNVERDELWLTGDIVNRGPDSLATLRFVHDRRDNIIMVLGNHDLHLLATAFDHRSPGKKDTLDEILYAHDSDVLLDWLRHQPLFYTDSKLDIHMVHAGLHPSWSVNDAGRLANEVEQILTDDDSHIAFYHHMYGDKPRNWSDGLTGFPRLRFITNVLSRMRYCSADGELMMKPKGPPGSQPDGALPWYMVPGRRSAEDRIIFGHWSTLSLNGEDLGGHNVYPLDTGCLWGGQLTAVRIDDLSFEQTSISCPQTKDPKAHV